MKMIIVIALLFSKWLLKGTTLVVVQIIQGNCAHFVFLNWRTYEWQRHLVSCFLPSSHNVMCHIRKMIWWIWGDIVKILLCQLQINTNNFTDFATPATQLKVFRQNTFLRLGNNSQLKIYYPWMGIETCLTFQNIP